MISVSSSINTNVSDSSALSTIRKYSLLNLDMKAKSGGSRLDLWGSLRKTSKDNKAEMTRQTSSPRSQSKTGTPSTPLLTPSKKPLTDGHSFEKKYGMLGKKIGTGAGGTVHILARPSDGKTFAVKKFASRHPLVDQRDYHRKIMSEFYAGSLARHGNIIETIEVLQEHGYWYQVMEYAPYGLFECVTISQMTTGEITCSFLQILAGVNYLHGIGLAHRDLKLENVVVSEQGIMKIIDFGSATVFKQPGSDDINLVSGKIFLTIYCSITNKWKGIVGCGPYLAPEMFHQRHYDARKLDIWSLAIIYFCMTLRQFPWQMAHYSDPSFKSFVSPSSQRTSSEYVVPKASQVPLLSTEHVKLPEEVTVHEFMPTPPMTPRFESIPEDLPSTPPSPRPSLDVTAKNNHITGPARLLQQLPQESWHVIQLMLHLDPRGRLTIRQVLEDSWIKGRPVCSQDEDGAIHWASDHQHTILNR